MCRPGNGGPTLKAERRPFFYLLSLSLFAMAGCAGRQANLPIRIGLLADSQITSPHSTPGCVYRNKDTDKKLEVSIRPPALEHLTPEVLKVALDKLSASDDEGGAVDVILYLGDGANSGGADEIERLFEILEEHRRKTRIPTFMVIGNHDYLGAGNTPNEAERLLLLNCLTVDETPPTTYNRPLSKYEVLHKISDFNRDPNYLAPNTPFAYVDNRDTLDERLDHRTGLYLAGHLLYTAPGEDTVEIFLADTSDYQNTPIKPEAMKMAMYGVEGSISSKNRSGSERPAQIDCYFEQQWAIASPDFRFIASHYHPDNLDRARFVSGIPEGCVFELENFIHGAFELVDSLFGHRYANRHLHRWLSGRSGNYWLSGHTHRETMGRPGQGQVHVGGVWGLLTDASFRSVNIGSTTDHRAHVAMIEAHVKGRTTRMDEHVGYREIPLCDADAQMLKDVFAGISAFGREKRNTAAPDGDHSVFPGLEEMDDGAFGATILGLNKQYQAGYWQLAHTNASVAYLQEFITWFQGTYPEYTQADVISCLAFIAGANEEGKAIPARAHATPRLARGAR